VKALRQMGYLVLSLAPIGSGCPDLLTATPGSRSRRIELLEVKSASGKLTDDQAKFQAQGWPVTVVRNLDDLLDRHAHREDALREALTALGLCIEYGRIVNGFPTCVRLNDSRARLALEAFASGLVATQQEER
jgi:hypothetical protein